MTATPLAAVHQYIAAFNRGDSEAMADIVAVEATILDGMVPHVWRGPGATRNWYRDVLIEGEQYGASEYLVSLSEPLHNNTTGDSAYISVPATMTFKLGDRRITQTGATFTVALRRFAEGWRIEAWAWAKGAAK